MICAVGPATETVRLDHLVGGSFVISIDPARAPALLPISVAGVDPDPAPGNNATVATLPVPVGVDLSIAGSSVDQVGEGLLDVSVEIVQLASSNVEPRISSPATLEVRLPNGVSFVSSATCVASNAVVTCTIGPATEPVRLDHYVGGVTVRHGDLLDL